MYNNLKIKEMNSYTTCSVLKRILKIFFKKTIVFSLFFPLIFTLSAYSQKITIDKNKPERKAWFQQQAFGMFIHWSIDVQLGTIISHNVAASSDDYQQRYFNELPKYFDPDNFNPDRWAKLAKLAGMNYMVVTAKHHNGFCLWDTETVDFKITNTPYKKDILAEIIAAFRKYDIAIGLYYSPDDFYLNYLQGIPPSRDLPEANPDKNEKMWEIEKQQIKELLTNYGKIDLLFIDEYKDYANSLVARYCWELSPDLLITRGGMKTPEQKLPEKPLTPPWEACMTIGEHWGYVAGEEVKDGTTLINKLIETRAKGGNLLLNVSPDSHGKIPLMQEARLREMALWNMANAEAIYNIVPFDIAQERITSNYHHKKPEVYNWYTQSPDKKTVYVFVSGENWGVGSYRSFFFRTLSGSSKTKVTILGQNDVAMEYRVEVSPKPEFFISDEGILVRAIRSQRTYKGCNNPVVIKIENAEFNQKYKKL